MLTHDNFRELSIPRQHGWPRQNLRLAGGRDGFQGRLKIRTDDLIKSIRATVRRQCRTEWLTEAVQIRHRRIGAGEAKNIRRAAGQTAAHALGVGALHADVRAVVALHFEEHHFDQHLRFWRVEICDDVADLQTRLLIRDHNNVMCLRVNGDDRVADRAVVVIARRAATGIIAATAKPTTAEAAKPPKSAATAALLRGQIHRRTKQHRQRDRGKLFKIIHLHKIIFFGLCQLIAAQTAA